MVLCALQCVAVCVAVCCSVLKFPYRSFCQRWLEWFIVCCSVFQFADIVLQVTRGVVSKIDQYTQQHTL